MNVASLELCKELYELSEWSETDDYYGWIEAHQAWELDGVPEYPAYNLGYLLRKLPQKVGYHPLQLRKNKTNWFCGYDRFTSIYEPTPEGAACKLAITLFEQGVLTKEQEKP